MTVYYNEHDRDAVSWLVNLAEAGLIPTGRLDSRDVQEVTPDDVREFRHCHWFAGIGGWPLALSLAGWDPARPVWTASCPCQPFSSAGKGKGEDDPRHLWPVLRRIIAECRPPTIFGEQVESKAGRRWLAGVRADLEALGYRFGAADLCAASAGEKAEGRVRHGDQIHYERVVVGPPHIRQRLFWVADAIGERADARRVGRIQVGQRERRDQPSSGGQACGMADTQRPDLRGSGSGTSGSPTQSVQGTHGERERIRPDSRAGCSSLGSSPGGMAVSRQQSPRNHDTRESISKDSESSGRRPEAISESRRCGEPRRLGDSRQSRLAGRTSEPGDDGTELKTAERTGGHAGFWSNFDFIPCLDGKTRRVESGLECLVDGVPFRLADGRSLKGVSRRTLLKGFGNAIVPELAAEFILAYLEATE